jgi:hypothetical protein
VRFRNVARWCALAGMAAALVVAGPAVSYPGLPECAPGAASTASPTGPAGPGSPGACQAGTGRTPESSISLEAMRGTATPSGYHHLGAGTSGEWAGVSGRISIVDGSVRQGTYDFVAGRFMVKRDLGGGRIAWLEAGWAETGWAGDGRQHIYTFNTNTQTWQFYDQYALMPGDRVWLDLRADSDGVWQAWLWWNNRWNLLTTQRLPIGRSAYIEQYIEVHVDSGKAARIDLPPVTVDNVQLRPAGGGPARYWRDDVATLTGDAAQQRGGGFCLDWTNRYDTWTAGDCPGRGMGGGLLAAPPEPPSGDADVVSDIRPGEQTDESRWAPLGLLGAEPFGRSRRTIGGRRARSQASGKGPKPPIPGATGGRSVEATRKSAQRGHPAMPGAYSQ